MKRSALFLLVWVVIGEGIAPGQTEPFKAGSWDLEIKAAYVQPIIYSTEKLYGGTVGASWYIFDRFTLGVEMMGYHIDQYQETDLGGGALTSRWHFLQRGPWSLFIDGAGGLTIASHPIPEFGSHFNFTGQGGFGATWKVDERFFLIGGARYFHLSNGDMHGRIRNPSFNGVQYYVGLMVFP